MSAHPRQERGGARLSQHGVTAPGDDADYVDPEGNQSGRGSGFLSAKRVPGRFHHPRLGMARAGPSRSIGPPAWGQHGFLYMNRESKIDDRVPIPVMLDTALAARRPRFRLQHWIVEVEGLAQSCHPGKTTEGWHPDFTTRALVKQLLLRGPCLRA